MSLYFLVLKKRFKIIQLRPIFHRNNKKKIFNDPVYGFISIPSDLIFDLIQHPYFQRLRRISQLGLTNLVYPGALHTRFHHVIGAMHLMTNAVATIRRKGHEITPEEEQAVLIAILLHDIGHGPFSHTLEHDLIHNVSHESISSLFISRLNKEFNGELEKSLKVFSNTYPKKFLHQLVSSQLDMDRLDYLNRDSFYTGVSEGKIGSDRIIEMLNVKDGELVLEEKGIYSIEKFIVARRLMYWQVYLHKTVVASEKMLIRIIQRAKELSEQKIELFGSPAFLFFLSQKIEQSDFVADPQVLEKFAELDDYDVLSAVKVWQNHPDKVLSLLCKKLINRELFKIEISKAPFDNDRIQLEKKLIKEKYNLNEEEVEYFIFHDKLINNAYNKKKEKINILMKNGSLLDISKASDNLNISALAHPVEKYFLCYPN
jgi:HD superfamily phosphohydrolase